MHYIRTREGVVYIIGRDKKSGLPHGHAYEGTFGFNPDWMVHGLRDRNACYKCSSRPADQRIPCPGHDNVWERYDHHRALIKDALLQQKEARRRTTAQSSGGS